MIYASLRAWCKERERPFHLIVHQSAPYSSRQNLPFFQSSFSARFVTEEKLSLAQEPNEKLPQFTLTTFAKKEEGKAGGVRRTNEQTLKYKTSWKINVSCSHTISPLFRFFAAYKWAEELFYTFSFSFAAQLSASLLLHSLPCFAKRREENQKRYLNFYTQLIWEWLFKGDVYNTILTDPSTQHGSKATPFKMPWISLFVLPLSTKASDFTESHCFVIALRIINSWQR